MPKPKPRKYKTMTYAGVKYEIYPDGVWPVIRVSNPDSPWTWMWTYGTKLTNLAAEKIRREYDRQRRKQRAVRDKTMKEGK